MLLKYATTWSICLEFNSCPQIGITLERPIASPPNVIIKRLYSSFLSQCVKSAGGGSNNTDALLKPLPLTP